MSFKEIRTFDIEDNAFRLISKDWMLITAGKTGDYNTMTASWGGFGHLWHRDVCYIFIRPQRHTFSFLEREELFTLSFFAEDYREALKFCGTKSGREIDKAAVTGLTPVASPGGGVCFAEARLVIECRKIYFQDISPEGVLDKGISSNYTKNDYHRMYIGQIQTVLSR